jgi:hypothetical protein
MGGSALLDDSESVAEARKVVKEKLVGAQKHDPNMVQLPGGGWGTVVPNQMARALTEGDISMSDDVFAR